MLKKILIFISVLLVIAAVAAVAYWLNIDKNIRYLILNQPKSENVLAWTIGQRDAAFRVIEDLGIAPYRAVAKGDTVRELPKGEGLNIDQNTFDAMFEKQRIAGLVVLHNGELRLEKYGLDFNADRKWTSFSVAKSFTSTLIGAALKDGYIKSLDDKVSDYIPDMQGSVYDDVSIEQLLTMSSGVKWNEDYADPNSDVSLFNFHQADAGVDATVSYMRQLPRAYPAGERYNYSTGETNLIGVVASAAIKQDLAAYLSEKIWSRIGAEQNASWLLGSTGHEISGCCIQATTRDFARFGQFILEGAMVENERIVPEGWLAEATRSQIQFGDSSGGYGYQWWTNENGSFQARGIFGQGIFIDPKRNLVIAVNSNWPIASGEEYTQSKQRLYRLIQRAVDSNELIKP